MDLIVLLSLLLVSLCSLAVTGIALGTAVMHSVRNVRKVPCACGARKTKIYEASEELFRNQKGKLFWRSVYRAHCRACGAFEKGADIYRVHLDKDGKPRRNLHVTAGQIVSAGVLAF